MNTKAVSAGAAITGLVTAGITFVSAFNWYNFTQDQTNAIFGVVSALLFFGAYLSTLAVPKDVANKVIEEAYHAPPDPGGVAPKV